MGLHAYPRCPSQSATRGRARHNRQYSARSRPGSGTGPAQGNDLEGIPQGSLEHMAAMDFFTVEVWTPVGLVRYHVLFVMRLMTREIHVAGIVPEPAETWMLQMARNLTDGCDGFLCGTRFLIHDRSTLFTEKFRAILKSAGVEPLRLPARSPNLNAFAERFV